MIYAGTVGFDLYFRAGLDIFSIHRSNAEKFDNLKYLIDFEFP